MDHNQATGHNTMDVIHGYQLTYCSYSWLSKIPWMLIMVNHGSYSFIVVSGGTPQVPSTAMLPGSNRYFQVVHK